MLEDLIDFNLPVNENAIITVVGIGGGGNNAVNRMFEQGIQDVDFMVVNTDSQALHQSAIPVKIRIGETLTEGRGAGNRPDVGEQAAIENIEDVIEPLNKGTKMVFLVAGLGGGTGTGATPVIAKACRERGILTVGVVTLPFRFEGPLRLKQALHGLERLRNAVDAMLIIHNEKIREIYGNLSLSNAFGNADNVLTLAVKGIAEIITLHGYINVDFADVVSVMTNGGIAFMGSAEAAGHNRAKKVIEDTINSPLLNSNDIQGAQKVLLNIAYGPDEITVDEIGIITDTIIEKVGGSVNTIWGTCVDETLEDKIRITLVATGFTPDSIEELMIHKPPNKTVVQLENQPSPQEKQPELESVIPLEDIEEEKEEIIDLNDQLEEEVEEKEPEESKEEQVDEAAFNLDEEEKFDPYAEENEQLRIKAERLKALNYNNITDPDRVDEMEREPAFKRKQVPIQTEMFPEQEKSRYSVSGKDNRLHTNNSYLHDAVD